MASTAVRQFDHSIQAHSLRRRRSIVLSAPTPVTLPSSFTFASCDFNFDVDLGSLYLSSEMGSSVAKSENLETARSRQNEKERSEIEAGPSRLAGGAHPFQEDRRGQGDKEKKKKHRCSHEGCDKSFKKASKLHDHLLTHSDKRPHQCPHCPSAYKKPTHLSAHLRSHLDPSSIETERKKSFRCSGVGCEKGFWTGQHLRRHEEACEMMMREREGEASGSDSGLQVVNGKEKNWGGYKCGECEEVFKKHKGLQPHAEERHADQEGVRDGSVSGSCHVKKRYACEKEGCEWSFETNQKLRTHGKTHDTSRYICSDSSHPHPRPTFRTWTDLQKHLKSDHPPTCPYPSCNKRQFPRRSNLKDHLRIHEERGDVLRSRGDAGGDGEVFVEDKEGDDDLVEIEVRSRKRRRVLSEGQGMHMTGGGSPMKRLRRASSLGIVIAKEWECDEKDCSKAFKTEAALKRHHQTAHLGLRPFACSHLGCDKAYGHRHLLQRHIAARHRSPSADQPADDVDPTHPAKLIPTQPPSIIAPAPSALDFLTGHSRSIIADNENRTLRCPIKLPSTSSPEANRIGCSHRSAKVYDLQRHIGKRHGLTLTEVEVRVLLQGADGML